jgi:anti-sigma regulatory factor (Ser/Thr protein kinase)
MSQLILPAKLENLDSMIKFIMDEADALGFDEKNRFQIRLAAEEILVNIINYAYPDKPGDIEITLTPKENKGLEIEVVDWGFAFNPLAQEEPKTCAPLEERKIGGLGIFLTRKVMNDVRYRRDNDRNIMTLIKKLP